MVRLADFLSVNIGCVAIFSQFQLPIHQLYVIFSGLEHLPHELQRNFTLMRELDSRAQTLMKSIDEKADDFMKTLVKDKDSIPEEVRKDKLKNIQDLFNKAKEYGDDKVQLAIQTYELVDKHIRRLDSDLARFEGEIQDKTLSSRSKSEENVGKRKIFCDILIDVRKISRNYNHNINRIRNRWT